MNIKKSKVKKKKKTACKYKSKVIFSMIFQLFLDEDKFLMRGGLLQR